MKKLYNILIACYFVTFVFTNTNAQNKSNTFTVPPFSYTSNSGTALLLKANKDESNNTNENIYMSIGSGYWWNKVKLEVQKEGGIGTRGGMFMDWGHLYLVADWDNTSTNEHIYFGFDGNTRNLVREKMILTNAGRLGIGTLTPTERLHVNGGSKINGKLIVSDTINSQGFSSIDFFRSYHRGISFHLIDSNFPIRSNSSSSYLSSSVGMGANAFSYIKNNSSGTDILSYHNTGVGFNALHDARSTARFNTGVGSNVLKNSHLGKYNTALGADALFSNSSGILNTAIGYRSLYNNGNRDYNIAVGNNALSADPTANNVGGFNIGVGSGTHVGSTDTETRVRNATAIGYNARVTARNTVRIGNTSVTSIGGYVNWSTLSDGRFKKNVQEDVPGLEFITKLKPVNYNYNIRSLNSFHNKGNLAKTKENALTRKAIQEREQQVHTGFIAQEVEAIAKDIGYDFSGVHIPKNDKNSAYNLRYTDFVVPLVKALQQQQKIIKKLKSQIIQKLESRILELEEEIAAFEND